MSLPHNVASSFSPSVMDVTSICLLKEVELMWVPTGVEMVAFVVMCVRIATHHGRHGHICPANRTSQKCLKDCM